MPVRSREVRLVRRPEGWPVPEDFELAEVEVPDPGEGEVLVRSTAMSVDPYMRGRMNAGPSYAAPYRIGAPMYGGAVGTVVASRVDSLPEGTVVRHGLGWREQLVLRPDQLEVLQPGDRSPSLYLGALGMPGLTAWVGLFEVAGLADGESVFVSAASGAVGSVAGQLAKAHGCRVVGSAGSPEKAAFVVDELGFDACIDYRHEDLDGRLQATAPDGVDVYFDNVGGAHLRAALSALNDRGRIAACGMISTYNDRTPGPDNLNLVVGKRLRMQGFIVSDHAARTPDFLAEVEPMVDDGRLVVRETFVDGIGNAVDALLRVLRGGSHLGKMVVRL